MARPLRLGLERAAVGGGEPAERAELDPAVHVLPGPGDGAVEREGRERLRRLGVEDLRPVLLGQDAGAAGVDEQARVPRAEEARRGGRVRVGARRAGDVEQVAVALEVEAVDDGGGEAGERGDVLGGGGAEAGEVAPHEVLLRGPLADLRRADPVLGERVEVGPPPLPRARRRRPHEVDPQPDAVRRLLADQRLDLLAPQRVAARERGAHLLGGGLRRVALRRPQPRRAARLPHGQRERPVVLARDQVDRAAHQRALDDAALLERAGEVGALEPLQARPQPDVHRRRVLRLQPGHPLEQPRDGIGGALEQALAGQEGAVEGRVASGGLRGRAGSRPRGARRARRGGAPRGLARPRRARPRRTRPGGGPPGRARASPAGRPRRSRGGG